MLCSVASELTSRQLVWTVTNLTTQRFIQCVPAHLVTKAMAQLSS